MKKPPSSKSPGAPKRQKTSKNVAAPRKSRKTSKKRDDPFAAPPHPLGFNFLSEERPIRASKFASILPTLVAKYGFGRKIGVERFHKAWDDALATVFRAEAQDAWNDAAPWDAGFGGSENWGTWENREGQAPPKNGEKRATWDNWNDWDNWGDWGAAPGFQNQFDPEAKLATFSQHARPVAFRGGALAVCVESRLLCQELSFYLPQILQEIQAALPDENVEKIKLVVR